VVNSLVEIKNEEVVLTIFDYHKDIDTAYGYHKNGLPTYERV